jgi:hypothetical protein
MSDIADLLDRSRAAHLAARNAGKNLVVATAQWRTALDLRTEAQRLDPQREDPSWLEDALHPKVKGESGRRYHRVPGKTPADIARDRDLDLVQFYLAKLDSEPAPDAAALTDDAIAQKVLIPTQWQLLVAGVTPCVCGHEAKLHVGSCATCTVELAPGQPCDCATYQPTPCRHAFEATSDKTRRCAGCGEQQHLVETLTLEQTEAYVQLCQEQGR